MAITVLLKSRLWRRRAAKPSKHLIFINKHIAVVCYRTEANSSIGFILPFVNSTVIKMPGIFFFRNASVFCDMIKLFFYE